MHEPGEMSKFDLKTRMQSASSIMDKLKQEIYKIDRVISQSNPALGENEDIIDEWAHMGGGVAVEGGLFTLADSCIDIIQSEKFNEHEQSGALSALEDYVQRLERHIEEFRDLGSRITSG